MQTRMDDANALRRTRRPPLDREQIVTAALHIADTEGIDAVSMRRVAADLGVGTMSLYGHVPDKQTLVGLMVDRVFGEYQPPMVTGHWREDATALANLMRRVITRHQWLPLLGRARPLATPSLYRNLMDHMEHSLSIYDGLGLSIREAAAFDMLVDTYVMGFVAREHEDVVEERAVTGSPEFFEDLMPQLYTLLTDGEHPRMAAFITAMQPGMLELLGSGAGMAEVISVANEQHENDHRKFQDELFELGLECILDGIGARIAAHSKP